MACHSRASRVHQGRDAGEIEDTDVLIDTAGFNHLKPVLSIVVPTRNEAPNIEQLVDRLEQAVPHVAFEIVFVDDSDDGTVAAIETVRTQAHCDIRLIHRPSDQRRDGLGGAVVTGLRATRAPWVCVMDADLQHPPELIPRLLDQAEQTDADLVVASRYTLGGHAGLGRPRSGVSYASTAAARFLFPHRLRGVSDPMSGFFLMRKAVVDLDTLRPRGFKILLEILVRTPSVRVAEVGFQFGKRHAGSSKASLREGMRYLSHLACLRLGEDSLRFMRFLLVGASGLAVNTLLLAIATETLGLYYLVAAIVATQGSTLWNFGLAESWVFRKHQQGHRRILRLIMFLLMNNAAFLLRGPMIYLLTTGLGVNYLLSNFFSLVALTFVRYAVADHWIWGRTRYGQGQCAVYSYDIHGIVTVTSTVWLPELQQFLTKKPVEQPTIRIRVGNVDRSQGQHGTTAASAAHRLCYDENIGLVGFGIDVTIDKTIDVLASPLLRWSPHVLYTNVVEPILRWTFVEKGYALVHGACIAFGKDAYLVTARTDTGKTTTVLRILDRQRRVTDTGAFLSDDLTLIRPDGCVLPYPKPLTISRHTTAAINNPLLSRRERFSLIVQSRLHSREGRRFALLLAQTGLPVATINAVVQFLVPPPKYHIQRLVPHVKAAPEAKLAGLFVIERGGEGDIRLDDREALELLMSNCEDAYGFPPYPSIKRFLHGSNERDLQAVEREIVAAALKGHSALLLRSTKMDWAQRIAAIVNAPAESEEQPLLVRSVGGVTTGLSAS